MRTPTEIIAINNVSGYLAANAVAKGALFSPYADPKLPLKLYMEGKALSWGNQYGESSIQSVANYVFAMDGRFGSRAVVILNQSGGGSIVPINPATSPNPLEFEVGADSPIPTGGNTLTIPAFKGYNIIFIRNNIPQSSVNNGNTYFTWNKITTEFTCIGDANEFELFQLYPTA